MRKREKKEMALSYLRDFFIRYRHAWILSYFAVYLPWFGYLERTVTKNFHIITMPVDLEIPFCEYFIIPYILWFAYVAFGIAFFFFQNKEDYYKLCAFLFAGMTIFLVISTIYPNGHYLRPTEFAHDNWCTDLVSWLYQADTATNLFPSIHVYNSLGVHIAITHSEYMKNKKFCKAASFTLCCLIILSTMLLKQHSVFDVLTAFGTAAVMYYFVYRRAYQKALAAVHADQPEQGQVLHDLRM